MNADELKSTTEKITAEVSAKFESHVKATTELLAVTGKATVGEAMAMVAGLKETASKVPELTAELAKRDEAKRASDVTALFDAASKDGRLTPAKRKDLEAQAFAKDPAQLKAFLDCLQPVVVPLAAHAEPATRATSELNTDEASFARQLNIDPKKILETKALAKK